MMKAAALKRNDVRVIGNGERTLVFAHGYGCDQTVWRHVTPAFEEQYKIVLFDHVGSGQSDSSAFDRSKYSSLHGYAQDVLEILDAIGAEKVNFVGHSVSCMIGSLAAIENPDRFETLTMIGPSPCYINDGDYIGGFEREDIEGLLDSLENNHVTWSASMAPTIMENGERPELAAELEASFCRMDPLLAHHFARVTFLSDNRADLALTTTRTLILQCQKDIIAGLAVGTFVNHRLPNNKLVIMDATGHCPHMSAPGEVIREMQRFL
jgi:sigma-B regulation protein RsbQ